MIPTDIDLVELLVFTMFIATLSIFIIVMLSSSGKGGNVPPGPCVRVRPRRDLKAIMKWQKEKEKAMAREQKGKREILEDEGATTAI